MQCRRHPARLWPAAAALVFVLGGCVQPETDSFVYAPVEGFAGIAVADEPRAALVGREILGNGGTAADAAVAMYLTMTVTMPSRAGLGGGGLCVVFDGSTGAGDAVEFMPQPSPSGGVVPGGVRTMAALHARYGGLRWAELVTPAEGLARFGHAVSRAFAHDIAAGAAKIERNPALRRLLTTRQGRLAVEGDRITQFELAGVLSGIRQRGAGYLYVGAFANRLADAAESVGLPMNRDDLRNGLPRFVEPIAVEVGDDVAYFAPPPTDGGIVAAQIWRMLADVRDYEAADGGDGAHLLAEASLRALSERARWFAPGGVVKELPDQLVSIERAEQLMASFDPGRATPDGALELPPEEINSNPYSAGLAVVDARDNLVACTFTMNGLFGTGRVAPGTGILLAAPPTSPVDGVAGLSAVVVGNRESGKARFAAASVGGLPAPVALAEVMLEALHLGTPLRVALERPRLYDPGAPREVRHEAALADPVRAALARRGHDLRTVDPIALVNAIHCPGGAGDEPERCESASDPRGHGLANSAQ